ncbi:nucleoside diphosphate kinase [Cichlidogyrus casuarinus]|uniref:Nucleoside diphosphate kinase n=1 Tax=Cichlidogyrus casuarinus TaxID=1844966 RepID=A0ABD2QAR6_9PLAT
MNFKEQTFICVKPDGVQRGLIPVVLQRFTDKGLKLVAMKFMSAPRELLKEHYKDLADKPFYSGLVEYMSSGPVCAMVWEGQDAVVYGRKMLGATRPIDSEPGTIRGDYCLTVGRNAVHGSDAVDSAKREIQLWFKPDEIVNWKLVDEAWILAEN